MHESGPMTKSVKDVKPVDPRTTSQIPCIIQLSTNIIMKLKLPFGNNNNNEDAEAEQPMVNEEAEPTLVDEEPDVSKEKSRAPSVHYGDEK